MQGRVFAIEEFSVFDGEGIRTTVFLKGCPLRCSWCHNPEGQRFQAEYIKAVSGCLACGRCLEKCRQGRLTQESLAACPRELIRLCGVDYSPGELAAKLLKNADVFALTGGGVTFSGGEPLAQGGFLLETLKLLEGKVHRAVQTSGYGDRELFCQVLANCDHFLYDLKLMDPVLFRRYCGADNQSILENFRILAASKRSFVTRVPLIPGVTDTKENLGAIAAFLKENGVERVELLAYNPMAGAKYPALLRSYRPGLGSSAAEPQPRKIFEEKNIACKEV